MIFIHYSSLYAYIAFKGSKNGRSNKGMNQTGIAMRFYIKGLAALIGIRPAVCLQHYADIDLIEKLSKGGYGYVNL